MREESLMSKESCKVWRQAMTVLDIIVDWDWYQSLPFDCQKDIDKYLCHGSFYLHYF